MADNHPVAETIDLHKTYADVTRQIKVLRGINIQLGLGDRVAITGASGAGKSTLLHLLAGLDRPTQGEVFLHGDRYSDLNDEQLSQRRARSIGIVYQFHHLLPEFTALENVMIPVLVAGASKEEAREKAAARLQAVGLGERLDHRPAKLSGGERQRVAIARALVNDPPLLLADEPTGNLDADTARETIDLLWKSTLENDHALVIVTHEMEIARRAGRIFALENGQLRERGAESKSA